MSSSPIPAVHPPIQPHARPSPLVEWLAIARYHIVLVAMAGALVFGRLMTGRTPWLVTLVVALDWFVINLLNRVTDVEEDRRNAIVGTGRVADSRRALVALSVVLLCGSFAATHWLWPRLTPLRVAVQLIGFGYNYKLVPTPRGLSRFKELYFFKNFMSAVIFLFTCFGYPLAVAARLDPPVGLSIAGIVCLMLFFTPFELTYEILYDLRDLEGDRAEGIPTYPVVHGAKRSRQIIDALLLVATAVLLGGLGLRFIGLREGLLLFAPLSQFLFYRPRLRRGLTARDCITLTHLGTAQILLFLAGNAVWAKLGLPANVYF